MQSNYITRGCAVCVKTAAMSDQHQEAGMGTMTLHTYSCNTPQTATLTQSILSSKLLKTSCKIERARFTLQRY